MASGPMSTATGGPKDQDDANHHYKTVAQVEESGDAREMKGKTGNPGLDDDGVHKRTCTDIPCALVWLAFVAGMMYCKIYAMSNGNMARLTHGFDAAGKLCGVDAGVQDKPLLYYCPLVKGLLNNVIPLAIDPNNPTCVAACPMGNQTDPCSTTAIASMPLPGQIASMPSASYPTQEILGLYCLPDLNEIAALAAMANETVPFGLRNSMLGGDGPVGGKFEKFTKDIGGLKRCYKLLIGSAVFALILGFVYFLILRICAKPLVYISMILIVLMFASISGFFLIGEFMVPRPAPIQDVVNPTTIAPAMAPSVAPVASPTPTPTPVTAFNPQTPAPTGGRRLVQFKTQEMDPSRELLVNTSATVQAASATAQAAYINTQAQLQQRWKDFGGRKKWEQYNPFYNEHMTPADARTCSLITGAVFGLLAFIVMCMLCCAHKSIDVAVNVVKVAVKCLFDGPSLLLVPLWDALAKSLFFGSMLYFFILLVSCGKITKNDSSLVPGGQAKSYSATQEQLGYIVYYLFGIFWVLEFLTAVGQFALSYAVVTWYYTKKDSRGGKSGFNGCTSWFKGVLFGCTVHMGTLALGSFLVALVRFIRFCLWLLKQATKGQAGGGLVRCIICIIDCCCMCIQKCIEQINKNAYIDVAINSSWFCTAAKHVFEFIGGEANALFILHGACAIFTIAGVSLIAGTTGYVTYLLCTSVPRWTDDTSEHHVNSPRLVAIVAGIIGVFIGYAFMAVFDHAADTLLYTYDWNKHHGHNTAEEYAPPELLALAAFKPMEKPKEPEKPKEKEKCSIQ